MHLKLPSAQVRGNLHETSHSQTTSRPIARRLSLDNNPLWLRDSTKKQSAGATNVIIHNLVY